MAKKTNGGMTAAEATRQSWKELGKDAAGTDVSNLVKSKHGFTVPSSTVSTAKVKVFGKGAKTQGRKAAGKTAPAGELPVQLKSKIDVVKELIAGGLNSPAEIVVAAKKLGHKISSGYVSMIKSKMGSGGKKQKRAARTQIVGTTSAARVVPGNEAGNGRAGANLEMENLALRFALRAGSVDAAIAALEKLK